MKRIISALILLSILLAMLCGCQNKSQDSESGKETTSTTDTNAEESTTGTSADSKEPFEEYAINITSDLMYLYEEPNYEAKTVGILEKGAYIVVDETSHTFGGVPLRWAKLKGYDGWIILNYIDDDYTDDNWNEHQTEDKPSTSTPETSENMQTPETDNTFKSYKIKVLNNCLSVYSQPKISSSLWLYDITDNRTITIVEERRVQYYSNYHNWARLESGGWVRLDDITDTTYNNSGDTTIAPETSVPDTSIPDTTVPDTTKPDDSETLAPETDTEEKGTLIASNVYGIGTRHTKTLNGITFVWYDKYTGVYCDSFEFISFSIKSEPDEEDHSYDAWKVNATVKISQGDTPYIKALELDANNNFLGHTNAHLDREYLMGTTECKIRFRKDWIRTKTKTIIIYPL